MLNEHLPKFLFPRTNPTQGKNPVFATLHRPRKVLIVNQFYPPDYAATGQLISELAAQLGNLGIQIDIFTGQPGYAFEKNSAPKREAFDRVSVQRSRTSRIFPLRIRGRAINGLLFCLRATLHLLKSIRNYDILLVTTEPPYLPVVGYFAYLLFRRPYVCLLYDLYPDVAVELDVVSPRHWLVRFWDWCNRLVWKNAQGIIVLSSTMKARVTAKYPAIADKVSIIASWADPDRIKPLDKENNWFAREFNLTHKFTVLYSGNLGRCHDMDTILDAAKNLENEPIQFVFIGHGAKLSSCLERAKTLELDNCLFLPYQEKSVLPYSLTACDLALVSISSGLEGLVAPSKLYGILAAGRPVAAICERDSYLSKLLDLARCGQAFENGDSAGLASYIRYLAADPQLAQTIGQLGRHYLKKNFTPQIIAQQYLEVLSPTKPHPD
ncbi:glycosyltransferase family 4 protein [Lusitaniella coriacea]|uniref:glycosyltransferase family 4 protein n=1 Tax=Lusitaniella coriacea TaxID=1983105 RepID=UPI003CEEC1F3